MFGTLLERWLTSFKAARQRAVFVFTPRTLEQREEIRVNLEENLTIDCWLTDHSGSKKVQVNRYRDYLGLTQQHVVLDFTQLIHADALAALAGTVDGGGALWLLLPSSSSAFQQRLKNHATESYGILYADSWAALLTLLDAEPPELPAASKASGFPSAAQQHVVSTMLQQREATHLILADRGRGKSTALGLAIQQAHLDTPVWVTGPRPSALSTLLKHAGTRAKFCAWDRLLRDPPEQPATLIIDEAAAIPLHFLRQLFVDYHVWAVATTVDGYEGCGQGFVLRFMNWLEQRSQLIKHQLNEPMRWAAADGLERWLNSALLLKSPPAAVPPGDGSSQLELQFCHASELAEHELEAVMQLLLEAHYQSSPNDLRLLLDDSSQRLLISRQGTAVVGVTWIAQEGAIDTELQGPISSGKRRLKGQLMPQAIGFYRQQPRALQWNWWRITRIAVGQAFRRRKIASLMLENVIAEAQQQKVDAIGTSFGVTSAVVAFWQHTPLKEIRRGLKKNAASGTVSALWAYGLNTESAECLDRLASLQALEQAWLHDGQVSFNTALEPFCKAIVEGFSHGALPFSNARFAWWLLAQSADRLDPTLELLLDPSCRVATLVERFKATSRMELERQLRQRAQRFLNDFPSEPFL